MATKSTVNPNVLAEVLETLRETYLPAVFDDVTKISTLALFLLPKFKAFNSTEKVMFKYRRYNTSQILARGDAITRDNGQETREVLTFTPTYIMKDVAFAWQDLTEIGADKTKILDFVASRLAEVRNEFYEDLSTFIYTQLDLIIDATVNASYGWKTRSSFLDNLTSLLAGYVDATGTVSVATIEAAITSATQKGKSRPDLIVANRVNKLKIGKLSAGNTIQVQTPLQTVATAFGMVPRTSNYISFVNAVFEDIPVLEDNFCSTANVYVLNTKALEGRYVETIIWVGDEPGKAIGLASANTIVTPEGAPVTVNSTGIQISGLVYDKTQFGYNTTVMWAWMLYSATPRAHGMIKWIA